MSSSEQPTMRDLTTSAERRDGYYERGSWTDETLVSRLALHADHRPDETAVVDSRNGRVASFADLHDDVRRMAAYLRHAGIEEGDVVSVQLPNRYETVVADLGVHAVGGVLNPLIPNYRQRELEYFLAAADSRAIFTPARYRGFDYRELGGQLQIKPPDLTTLIVVSDEEPGSDVRHMQSILPEIDAGDAQLDGRHPDAVTDVMFTSGTEAAPKAVMHTENTSNFGVRSLYEAIGMTEDDVVWMPSPLGHSLGIRYGLRLAVYFGLPLVLQDRWDPHHGLRAIREHGCSYTMAAPTFLSDLLVATEADGGDPETLGLFGSGGGPVPPELVKRAQDVGIDVLRLYGSSEGLVMTVNRPDSPDDMKLETDGVVIDDIDIRICDEAGEVVGTGVPGEIEVRGPNVCVGFFDDPERTAASFRPDGWLRSGDVGVLNDDGYLSIVGRRKEIIIRGGVNITPREIEDLLVELDDVDRVAVVGIPDERLGEIVCACFVLKPGGHVDLPRVTSYLEGKGLARYKLPQRIEVMDRFPQTPSGKIQKTKLARSLARDHAAEAAGSTER
jgi:acyl-CoA synthetase (AMP-forming)/AMP-acid ligase II